MFNSFQDCLKELIEIDNTSYKNNGFSIIGQSSFFDEVEKKNILYPYFIDSALMKDYNKEIGKGRYTTYFIQSFYTDNNEKAPLN